jgi:hypothetical protein
MEPLNERLEVRLSTKTFHLLRSEAKERRIPVAQLVRLAIHDLLYEDRELRKKAAEALFSVEAPVSEWPQMKGESEAPHVEGSPG